MNRYLAFLIIAPVLAIPSIALAYTGPGAGISAIGAVLAVIGAALFAVVGFVWYPVRRLLRSMKRSEDEGKE